MKTTLCLTCAFGLCREWEYYNAEITGRQNKCLLGQDYMEIVTNCNRYRKTKVRITYHDPDFDMYVKQLGE
jgi:hypothetical protein